MFSSPFKAHRASALYAADDVGQYCDDQLCQTAARIDLGGGDATRPSAVNTQAGVRLTKEQREFCERRLQQHQQERSAPCAGGALAPGQPASPASSAGSGSSESADSVAQRRQQQQLEQQQQQQQQQQLEQEEQQQQAQERRWEPSQEQAAVEDVAAVQAGEEQRVRGSPASPMALAQQMRGDRRAATRPSPKEVPGAGACAPVCGLPEEGWFKKCRGCGAMTVHELAACSAAIPFCMRCKTRVADLSARGEDAGLWDSLAHVHSAWSAAGL